MVSQKAAAGGVAALGTSIGAGYGISQISNSTTKENKAIKIKLETSKFEINYENKGCKEALETKDDNKYEDVLKVCAKSRNFLDRAKEWGLDVLIDAGKETDTKWSEKFADETRKSELKEVTKIVIDNNTNTWNNKKTEVVEWCNNNNKKITESFNHNDWFNFLKACTKDTNKSTEAPIDKDFWTKKDTYRAKMLQAKFALKTTGNEACTSSLLTKLYTETSDDFKEAVKVCVQSTNFKTRAEKLDLDTFPPSGSDSNGWETHWNTHKANINPIVTYTPTSGDGTWTDAKAKIQTFCTSSDTGNKNISKEITDDNWKKYLTACTKTKTGTNKPTTSDFLGKSFWTLESIQQ